MDPIWLWRLREGRSTWLNTCRSVVRMLKKIPVSQILPLVEQLLRVGRSV
ncbi:MAG: hypothetical protein L6W00_18715 [Lentisphaeria bacterium]|nr:MAG: hypothetical protein L6W00_18715 [Lentisphaeria bacterium]